MAFVALTERLISYIGIRKILESLVGAQAIDRRRSVAMN